MYMYICHPGPLLRHAAQTPLSRHNANYNTTNKFTMNTNTDTNTNTTNNYNTNDINNNSK